MLEICALPFCFENKDPKTMDPQEPHAERGEKLKGTGVQTPEKESAFGEEISYSFDSLSRLTRA